MKKIKKAKKVLSKKKPEKRLLLALKKKGGRNFSGRITIRHRGGGAKRLYRIVDFGEEKIDIPGRVAALEYDPNRTAYLALIEYEGNDKRYVLAPYQIKVGDKIICAEKAEIKTGNRMRLKNIPIGTQVFNIELEPGRGGKMIRSAGAAAKVLAQEDGFCHLKMPSKEIRKVSWECFATIGQVSRPEWRFQEAGRAGSSRLKGRKPHVRGIAMNPCDHPHGGGHGRAKGMQPKTPWGKKARGVRTRKKKWTSKYIIKRRK